MALVTGTSGSEDLEGTAGNDTILGLQGDDTLHGITGDDSLDGGEGNDLLIGSLGSDTLVGGEGNDTLRDTGEGVVVMLGGVGDDLYVVEVFTEIVSEEAGEGTDKVTARINYTLTANVENLDLATDVSNLNIAGYGNELNNVITGNGYANWLSGLEGNDTLYGGTWAISNNEDTLMGGNGDDSLTVGNFSNATLDGGAGNDTMNGTSSGGNATMIGGAGDDLYAVDAGDSIIENAGEGSDTIVFDGSYRLGANFENLGLYSGTGTGNGLANFIFSENNLEVTLSGLAGNDTLYGGDDRDDALLGGGGNDSLDGYGGADTMIGGAGNDLYVVDCKGDKVIERSGQGTDTVYSWKTYSLDANLENLVLRGSDDLFGDGNDFANSITGNSGDNLLSAGGGNDNVLGEDGNDLIEGGAGNDTIDGGEGSDVMIGGEGDDAYFVDSADDMTLEDAGEGTDSVVSTLTWTLDDDTEVLQLAGDDEINGYGNALANTIYGNDEANTLNGKGGADTMAGGNGDDSYYVNAAGDVVTEAAGQGTDMISSSVSYSLANAANVEGLFLTGAGAINGGGNAAANLIIGNSGANQLTGGNGHDTLVGGDGADSFRYAGTLAAAHSDTINDFTHGSDHIDLDDALFTAIGAVGNLAAGAFRSGNYTATTGAVDASDRILYNTTTGDVYYDSNGSGAGGRTLIFTLSESPDNLSASDIRVI